MSKIDRLDITINIMIKMLVITVIIVKIIDLIKNLVKFYTEHYQNKKLCFESSFCIYLLAVLLIVF
jgi:hypothetical protein